VGITSIITDQTQQDTSDDQNLGFDDLPLHEEGGVSETLGNTAAPATGPPPPGDGKGAGGRQTQVNAKHGDKLFKLSPNTSITILKLLEEYDWPKDDITDIGLTLENGAPKLGVLTARHLTLAAAINYHVLKSISGLRWSTIAIDTRPHVRENIKGHQRKMPALLTLGCYTDGTVYSADGKLQIDATAVDTAFANDRPYASCPPRGNRYVLELHNDNHSHRTLSEDRRLLKSVGFNIDGKLPTEWINAARGSRRLLTTRAKGGSETHQHAEAMPGITTAWFRHSITCCSPSYVAAKLRNFVSWSLPLRRVLVFE